jgi:beta-glucanase (GH16 family)
LQRLALSAVAGLSTCLGSDGYRLTFAEEFEAARLEPARWTTTMAFVGRSGGRYHNDSYLSYTTDDDVLLEDGKLRLRADRREIHGDDPVGRFEYSQGFVSTHDRFAFTYGYVEVRAKMPAGAGVWPTIWLMPTDYRSWPPEFDIAEYYATEGKIRFGLATGTMTDVRWDEVRIVDRTVEEEWQTYGLIWEPGHAVWLLNGEVKLEVWGDHVPKDPMYLILNNGVSSGVGPSGAPNDSTVFPNYLEVDYIRVYQRAEAMPVALAP